MICERIGSTGFKGIENITYNFLNLPMVIDMTEGRKIEYIYDAAGIKLSQRVYEDDTQSVTKTTDYIGERVYETKAGEPGSRTGGL